MDIGAAVGLREGVTARQIAELGDYATSDAFDSLERRVLDYATAMTAGEPNDALVDALRRDMSDAQIVELTAAIAWENFRARFNHALGIESDGFLEDVGEGAACAIPQRVRRAEPSAQSGSQADCSV